MELQQQQIDLEQAAPMSDEELPDRPTAREVVD